MLRQLRRLCRYIEPADVPMCAPSIYMEKHGRIWQAEVARETGYEGVACVDDAARLAVLLLHAHSVHNLPWALQWAHETLAFVLHLQRPDGNFVNFVLDWEGTPNLTGPTSAPEASPWLARALYALSVAFHVTGDEHYRECFYAALDHLAASEYTDVLGQGLIAVLEMHQASPDQALVAVAKQLAGRVSACRREGVLLNHPDEEFAHLWGHIQPAALCLAATMLDTDAWTSVAARSVQDTIVPIVRRAFERPRTLVYDVSSAVYNLDAVYAATGARYYRALARDARAWFHGRNSAAAPVYDPVRGMVFDGIDEGRVSENSGAESNVEGGLALFAEVPWRDYDFRS